MFSRLTIKTATAKFILKLKAHLHSRYVGSKNATAHSSKCTKDIAIFTLVLWVTWQRILLRFYVTITVAVPLSFGFLNSMITVSNDHCRSKQ